jgi:hypothetical protein
LKIERQVSTFSEVGQMNVDRGFVVWDTAGSFTAGVVRLTHLFASDTHPEAVGPLLELSFE